MDNTELLVFEPWADPLIDGYNCHPEHTYSRLAWLPVIGPSSWLVWGTLASQLRRDPEVSWQLPELAAAHGLAQGTGRHSVMRRTLVRLVQFRLLACLDDTHYLVRLSAPPVNRHQLERLPAFVGELHRQSFSQDPHRLVG